MHTNLRKPFVKLGIIVRSSNGLSTLHFLVLNVLMGWVIVEWMLAFAALESLMRAKCLRVLDTTSAQWSWTCNIYECDCGFLWNSPLCACHGQPYDTPRFACQYVRTIILDVSHLLLSAFCVRRACKDASLVLSVPKNLHPLVLSVFFFRFIFEISERHAAPRSRREPKKSAA